MCRLSRSCGFRPWPMMTSVEPPPISTTSRRSARPAANARRRDRSAALPHARRRFRIGWPSAVSANGRNMSAFLATRRAEVPTQRIASGDSPAMALAETLQTGQRARLRRFVEQLVLAEAAGQAHGFLQRIERIQLVAGHPRHFQAERVGAEIDRGKRVVGFHATRQRRGRPCR